MEKLYINKEDCCGCSACLNICPKHAIYMKHRKLRKVFVYHRQCVTVSQLRRRCHGL